MDKTEAYKIVFEDLSKVNLFMGNYDAKNSNETFMYGISTVMEMIATQVSDDCLMDYLNKFDANIIKSQSK